MAHATEARPPEALAPESELVYWTGRPEMRPDAVARCRTILREAGRGFDWGRLMDLAVRHRIWAMVARNFERHALGPISQGQYLVMQASYYFNSDRNRALARELRHVLAALNRHHVRAVVRKGSVLAHHVYADPGLRYMADFDFFVPPETLGAFSAVMAELGYVQGTDSPDRRTIRSLDRDVNVMWRLNIGSLPPFLRTTTEPCVEILSIDARHQMMEPAGGKRVTTSDLVARAQPVTLVSERAWVLDPVDFLIDLTVHLHKDANALASIASAKDLCIYRFLDVAEYCRFAGDRLDPAQVVARADAYGIREEVYFGLHFTDRYLDGALDGRLLEATRPADTSYLEEYGALDRDRTRWRTGFFERIFDWRRAEVASDRSRLLRPRHRRGAPAS